MVSGAGEALGQMNGLQHAAMLLGMTQNNGTLAESMAGMGMSRGMAMGRPAMAGMLGMAGLDPMSLALRAATSAFRNGGGVMGATAAGAAVGLPLMVGGQLASFAGDQMMQGAQQQMQLNSGLRRNFNFMNSSGGTGFTPSQGFEIGNHLRGMTHDTGPGGEQTTFGELTRMASNMGRMGMAQDVRSVRDFKDKFKQMLETTKLIAHDIGTSLEEAQKFMQSMKGSGIFNKADQLRMSQGTRMTSLAGGMAMSEVTGMANIGSQISRAVGGLGRSGAFAGMNAIGQVGIAQRIGAVSEEDIYNATGLNGAEGRQALATAQLQQSASFLSTGRGRRFLASMADRNGQLDQSAVDEWMAGGMGKGRTMESAYDHLGKVGRANFIRNEGRLRGSVLEKFGGLAQSIAYKSWLGDSGYDPHDMDDKAMLAFQRFSGMGRDEADIAIKQVQALPDILREQRDTERMAGHSDALSARDRMSGIAGIKRRLEHSREGIQNKLQQAGGRILEAGQGMLESWFNKTLGVYEEQATQGLAEVEKGLSIGGHGSAAQYNRFFGGATRAIMGGSGGMGGAINDIRERRENQRLQFAAMAGSRDKEVGAFGSKFSDEINEATLGGQGFGALGSLNSLREKLTDMSRAGGEKGSAARAMLDKFGFNDKNQLQHYTAPTNISDMMQYNDAASIRNMGGNRAAQIAMLQTLQEKAGVATGAQVYGQLKDDALGMSLSGGGGPWASNTDKLAMLGSLMTTGKKPAGYDSDSEIPWYKKAAVAAVGLASPLSRGASLVGRVVGLGQGIYNKVSGSADFGDNVFNKALSTAARFGSRVVDGVTGQTTQQKAFARTLLEDETIKGAVADLNGNDDDLRQRARKTLYNNLQNTRGQRRWEDMDDDQKGSIGAMASALVTSDHAKTLSDLEEGKAGAAGKTVDMIKQYQTLTGRRSMSDFTWNSDVMKQLRNFSKYGAGAAAEQDFINMKKSMESAGAGIQSDQERMRRMGLLGEKGLTDRGMAARGGLSAEGQAVFDIGTELSTFDITKGSQATIDKKMAEINAERKKSGQAPISFNDLDEGKRSYLEASSGNEDYKFTKGNLTQRIGKMSLAEKQSLAKAGAGTMMGDIASSEIATERKYKSLLKASGSDAGAIAKMMGVDMTEDDMKNLKGMGSDTAVQAVLEKADLGKSTDLKKGLMEALSAKSAGGPGTAIKGVLANMSKADQQTLQEKTAQQADPSYRALDSIRKNTEHLSEIHNILKGMGGSLTGGTPPEDKGNPKPMSPAK